LKSTFPDSEVAQKCSSARTKTEAIVNSVLAPNSVKAAYRGVATDGSNHGSIQIFPIIIQYFDWKNGGLQSQLIKVRNTSDKSVETVSSYIKETLEKMGLSEKCIAFTGENCNRRNAQGNNVFAKLKISLKKIP
jgi:hypothetical protein